MLAPFMTLMRGDARDELAVNDIVYAELAAGFEDAQALQSALDGLRISLIRIPVEALFLARHAFRRYRRAGGAKANVLRISSSARTPRWSAPPCSPATPGASAPTSRR